MRHIGIIKILLVSAKCDTAPSGHMCTSTKKAYATCPNVSSMFADVQLTCSIILALTSHCIQWYKDNKDRKRWDVPCCGEMWTCLVRWALEFARLETAEGGGSNSFSSMLASLTNTQDLPNRTILLSTFRVIILFTNTHQTMKMGFIKTNKTLRNFMCIQILEKTNWHLPQVK